MKLSQLFTVLMCCAVTTMTAQDLKIYVSDAENFAANTGKILQYDIDGSNPVTFIDEEMSWPQDIVFLADQNVVLISNLNSGRITRHNALNGAYIDDFAIVAGGPTRMKIGPDGFLYVLQWSTTNNKVLRFQLDGTLEDEYTDVGVPTSIGIDWDAGGNLYVSSFGQGNVTQFDTSGVSQGEFINSAELSGPTNIFFDNNGDLYVFDWNSGDIERYNSAGMHQGTFITGLGQVEGIDFLANGNLLIGNGSTAEVKQYLFDGTFVENTVESGSGGLEQPNAVIIFDRATLAVEDNTIANTQLVTPSIGSSFTVDAQVLSRFDSIQIFSTAGKLIETLSQQKQVWNASAYAEGMYFVVGIQSNKKITQKIIIKK